MEIVRENFDSDEEYYFCHWLEEMKAIGVVISYQHHPKPLPLSGKVIVPHLDKDRKGNPKRKDVFIMHDHIYEYDYLVLLNPDYEKRLFSTTDNYWKELPVVANRRKDGRLLWLVEVKPSYMKDQGSNTRFPLNQKWVWEKYGLYVQKVIPEDMKTEKTLTLGFFSKTFVPNAYRYRPLKKGVGYLKVKCKTVKSCDEYHRGTLQL